MGALVALRAIIMQIKGIKGNKEDSKSNH